VVPESVQRIFAARRAFRLGWRLRSLGFRIVENKITAIKKLMKKAELCDRYSVSQRTIENWMNSGILPFCKPSYGIVSDDEFRSDKALDRFQRNPSASGN